MKKLLAGLIALSCLSGSILTVNAEYSAKQNWWDLYTPYNLEAETFTYNGGRYPTITPSTESGIECKANFMITGVFSNDVYSVIYLDALAKDENGNILGAAESRGRLGASRLEPYMENAHDLDIGDMLYISHINIAEIIPASFYPKSDLEMWCDGEEDVEVEVEYVGYGLDIFGDEFMKVMRHEAVFDSSAFYRGLESTEGRESISQRLDIIMGDATEDENVDILDVITINKNVLGKTTFGGYAQYVADIDGNGAVDSTDSLNVLKYIVGITESLDDVQ